MLASPTIICAKHYSKRIVNNSYLHLGIFSGRELVGVMQWGYALNPNSGARVVIGTGNREYMELNRLWLHDKMPRNSESRAISYALKAIKQLYPPVQWVQSFADERCGRFGVVYQASNFDYVGSHYSRFTNWMASGITRLLPMRSRRGARGRYLRENMDRATVHRFQQFRYIRFLNKGPRSASTQSYLARSHTPSLRRENSQFAFKVIHLSVDRFICESGSLACAASAVISRELETLCREAGLQLLIACTDENPAQEMMAVNSLVQRQVDGLIVASSQLNDAEYQKINAGLPVVQMDRLIAGSELPLVITDSVNATADLVEKVARQHPDEIFFRRAAAHFADPRSAGRLPAWPGARRRNVQTGMDHQRQLPPQLGLRCSLSCAHSWGVRPKRCSPPPVACWKGCCVI